MSLQTINLIAFPALFVIVFILPGVVIFYPFKTPLLQPWYSRAILSCIATFMGICCLIYGFVDPAVQAYTKGVPMIIDGVTHYSPTRMWREALYPTAIYSLMRLLFSVARVLLPHSHRIAL